MTLFLVTYREVLEDMLKEEESSGDELEPIDVEVLQPDSVQITHNDLMLPVTVGKNDSLIVHIERAEGNLRAGTVSPFFNELPYWTLAHARRDGIDEIKLSPKVGESAILITSANKEGYVAVQRYKRKSDIFKIY